MFAQYKVYSYINKMNTLNDRVFNMMNQVNEKDKINIINKDTRDAEYAKRARKMREGIERPNLDKYGKRVGKSTHKMQTEVGEKLIELGVKGVEPGKWYSFPTLFPHKKKSGRWIDYGGGQDPELEGKGADLKGAYKEALSRGEIFEFGEDKKSAIAFGLGSWKSEE